MALSKNMMKRLFIFVTLVFIAIFGNAKVAMAENQFSVEEDSNNISYNADTVNIEEHFNSEDYKYVIEVYIQNIERSLEKSKSSLETIETITGNIENNIEIVESSIETIENNIENIDTNVETSENNMETVNANIKTTEIATEIVKTSVETIKNNMETVYTNVETSEIGIGIAEYNVETIKNNIEAINKELDYALEKVEIYFESYEKSIRNDEEMHKNIYNLASIKSTIGSIESIIGMPNRAVVNKVTERKKFCQPNIVKSFGNIENSYIKQAENAIMCIPSKLVESFIENDWKIYVTEEDINQVHFKGKYDRVKGMTSYENKFIKIENKDDAIKDGVFHEFGHYVDYINEFPSKRDEFKQIYKEEVNIFKSQTKNPEAVSNEGEFFAEIFHYMLEDPSICTTKAKQYVKAQLNMF